MSLNKLDENAYQSPSSDQIAAVDHFVSLTNGERDFLTLKSEWNDHYEGIPLLIESAIDHVIGGFNYGIAEYSAADEQRHQVGYS
mgnify:CR=1 FL=1